MNRAQFENLVLEALETVPQQLRDYIAEVDIVVEDWPSKEVLGVYVAVKEECILGMYEGIPLTERSDYGIILPDKITLFQNAIETTCSNNEEIVKEVRKTIIHETSHHFGIAEQQMEEMEV